jgi:hypothetical protein
MCPSISKVKLECFTNREPGCSNTFFIGPSSFFKITTTHEDRAAESSDDGRVQMYYGKPMVIIYRICLIIRSKAYCYWSFGMKTKIF